MDKQTIVARQKALVEAYTKSRFEGANTPEEAASILRGMIGHRETILAVAELVNTVGNWDGRVSARVRSWASGIEGAASPDELKAMGVYQPSEIHPAHIENLGSWLCATTGKEECR